MRQPYWPAVGCIALWAAGLASCGTSSTVVIQYTVRAELDTGAIARRPKQRDPRLASDFLELSLLRPVRSLFNSPGLVRRALGGGIEAYNLTAEDGVTNSTWFTYRNVSPRMAPAEVAQGPNIGPGPDTSGIWTVVATKAQGVMPGFTIRDSKGEEYLLKFDPPDYPELATAAEVISGRLFYAAGYHPPQLFITVFDPSKLKAAEWLTFKDEFGRERPVDDEYPRELLSRVARRPDGRVRAVASQLLRGGIGPFSFEGTRSDDSADTIPHQHRRELRGLYVMAEWLNHVDIKQHNTLDLYVEEGHASFVRHYLIDFGSSLGSAGHRPNGPRDGVEADLDAALIGLRLVTGGFYASRWERHEFEIHHPSIGYYSSELFDPGRWVPTYPNPAFAQRSVRDGYWGAKLVASFTEDQIRAAVSAGELSDPAAAKALVQAILARRWLTVRHWFLQVTPLEELSIVGSNQGPTLTFRDLAVSEGFTDPRGRKYQVRFEFKPARIRIKEVREFRLSDRGYAELPLPPHDQADPGIWEHLALRPIEERIARLELRAMPGPDQPQPRALRIYLLPDQELGYKLVGRRY